jgi:homoserine kinase
MKLLLSLPIDDFPGLVGFCISGSGPSLLAIYRKSQSKPTLIHDLQTAIAQAGLCSGRIIPVQPDHKGFLID